MINVSQSGLCPGRRERDALVAFHSHSLRPWHIPLLKLSQTGFKIFCPLAAVTDGENSTASLGTLPTIHMHKGCINFISRELYVRWIFTTGTDVNMLKFKLQSNTLNVCIEKQWKYRQFVFLSPNFAIFIINWYQLSMQRKIPVDQITLKKTYFGNTLNSVFFVLRIFCQCIRLLWIRGQNNRSQGTFCRTRAIAHAGHYQIMMRLSHQCQTHITAHTVLSLHYKWHRRCSLCVKAAAQLYKLKLWYKNGPETLWDMGEDKLDETRAVTLAPMHPHSNLLVGGKKISRHYLSVKRQWLGAAIARAAFTAFKAWNSHPYTRR